MTDAVRTDFGRLAGADLETALTWLPEPSEPPVVVVMMEYGRLPFRQATDA